jgi:DNA polymerase-3 subunit delta'
VVTAATAAAPPLVADERGALPLPWLAAPLAHALAAQRGHALLVHGSPGVGVLPYALTLAQALLCEGRTDAGPTAAPATGPCGHCASCHLVRSHLHPDLVVLMPEALRRAFDWPLVDDKPDSDESKRKPSRQIRIDEVRALIDWSTKTSARGRGKVAVLHPTDALNLQSANALLKTLEEPPLGTRLILTTADPVQLLPTVRSRCQLQALPAPPVEVATGWLNDRGLVHADVLLAACSGRPLDALTLAQAGISGETWAALPAAVARGHAAALAGWPVSRSLDALHKLCHDAMALAAGGSPRYFPSGSVPRRGRLPALALWSQELDRVACHDDHPWNEGLLLDALVQQGAAALRPAATGSTVPPRAQGG